MPEGDTVHKVAAAMRPLLEGRALRAGRLREYPQVRFAGKVVSDLGVHGKHLFVELDEREVLRTHLGMTGSWHRYAPDESWLRPVRQASVVLETDSDVFVCFNAKEVMVSRARGTRYKDLRERLGPDLLADEVDYAGILERIRGLPPATPVVDVLLDQSVAAGIGNVYKSEVLFVHGIDPLREVAALDDERLLAMFATASELLGKNLGDGPRVTRFPRDAAGRLWVYNRARKPCLKCDTPIQQRRLGHHGRATFFCPRCQPA